MSASAVPGPRSRLAAWVAMALYAALAAVLLGASLVDMLYARTEPMRDGAEVADALLAMTGMLVLVGIATVALAWHAPATRNLLLASIGLIVLTGAATPVLVAWLAAAPGWVGSVVRLVAVSLPCALALAGLYQYAGDHRGSGS